MGSRICIKESYSMGEICRTCAIYYEDDFLISIFKHNPNLKIQVYQVIKILIDSLQIEISENDYMPQNICRTCYSKFVDFKNFLDKCFDANNVLSEYATKVKPFSEPFLQKPKIEKNEDSINILEKFDSEENEFLDTTIDNQQMSLSNMSFIKTTKTQDQPISAVKDHDYQEIALDIIEENSDNLEENCNVEILDHETNFIEYENDSAMKVDFVSEAEFQVIENENIALLDCSYCNFAFSEEHFEQHMKNYHPVESPFLCIKCFRNFRTQSIRNKHVLLNMCQVNQLKLQDFQNNAVEIFVAEDNFFDSEDIVSEDEYIQEKEIGQEDLQLEKTEIISSEIMKNYDESSNHYEVISEKISFKCPVCNERFTKTKILSDHLRRCHPNFDKKLIRSKYACQICDKDCKSKQSLESHFNSHRGVKPFECEICKTSFFGSKALRTHKNNEHSSVQFNCEICGKDFSKKSIFITHMSNHRKDNDPNRKPDIKYKCQFCPRTFNTVSTLTIHSLTHKKLLESKHICNICGVTFKRADHLKMHMYGVHLDHKPFPCDQCDKSFPTAWQRNTHVKKYHSAEKKKYKCEICPNEYTSSNALKRHNMIHTGELKYNCDICYQKFSKIFLLEEHLKSHEIDENQRQESINEVYMEIAKSVIIPN